jgi:hypothetical protein
MVFETPPDDDPEQLRREVAIYPTDLLRRFRLGAALSLRQEFTEAIPELSRAMSSPHVRLAAMKLLAEAFEAKRMFDIAAHLRDQLSRESGDESGSGSAPVPVPTHPITPLGSDQAKKRPHEDDKIS